MSSESLKEFYSGKTIFVSGATGYIGRLLVAKLLRLGNVKEILICSRPKKGVSAEDRLEKILSGFLFEPMEKFDKSFRSKLRVVNCDLELSDLGITGDDREYIKNNVELMIHGGATVNFDEKLKKAIAINVRGTKLLLDLALDVKNLKSFVYVSTAFSNCPQTHVKEKFYKPPMGFQRTLELIEEFSDDVVDSLTSKLICPWPNTYTFTKAVAEDMAREYSEKLPISVIRPSVVVHAFEEPAAGFSDSMLALLGICIGVAAGAIRVIKCDPEISANAVPVDVVVNSVLAVAKHGTGSLKNCENVFNCVTSFSPDTKKGFNLVEKFARKYPTKRMLWVPQLKIMKAGLKFEILNFLYHLLPALFIDIGLRLTGSKLRLMKIYAKIYETQNRLYYFLRQSWTFDSNNLEKVYSLMSEQDHKEFYVRFQDRSQTQYTEECMDGIRKYFFKENDEDLINARRKLKNLQTFKLFLRFIVGGLILYTLSRFLHFNETIFLEAID